MIGARLAWRLGKRARRRSYRTEVERWNADGGDDRLRLDYPLNRDSLVFDLGGYQGQWASDLYARYRCRILVFEPVQRFAARIRWRFEHNDDIEVFDCALGGRTRSETIRLRGAGSSTYRHSGEAERIEIVDVRDWLAEHGIGAIQLMKINIEGGEYELLERLIETGAVERIDDIQVQFHYVEPASPARMAAIQGALARTHDPTYQYRFVWENWRRKAAGGRAGTA